MQICNKNIYWRNRISVPLDSYSAVLNYNREEIFDK